MVKVILDAGHGMNTPGKRTPDGGREWVFNDTVLKSVIAELNKYKDVQILRLDDPRGIRDIPLQDRTRQANQWGGDVLVSIHHNAFRSRWGSHGGVETYVAPNASKASVDIANLVQPKIVKAMGLRDRGVKRGNLHMVRESRMPAILTEGGFMDSETDIEALRSDDKLKAQGVAIATGLAEYFKLGKPAPSKPAPSKPAPSKPAPSKPAPNQTASIVEYLKDTKKDSSFANRKKLAVQYGIGGYVGTAAQNTALLNKLRSGSVASKPAPAKKGNQTTVSVVEYIKSIGQDASYSNRAKLATKHGISNYKGSASQNAELLRKLRY